MRSVVRLWMSVESWPSWWMWEIAQKPKKVRWVVSPQNKTCAVLLASNICCLVVTIVATLGRSQNVERVRISARSWELQCEKWITYLKSKVCWESATNHDARGCDNGHKSAKNNARSTKVLYCTCSVDLQILQNFTKESARRFERLWNFDVRATSFGMKARSRLAAVVVIGCHEVWGGAAGVCGRAFYDVRNAQLCLTVKIRRNSVVVCERVDNRGQLSEFGCQQSCAFLTSWISPLCAFVSVFDPCALATAANRRHFRCPRKLDISSIVECTTSYTMLHIHCFWLQPHVATITASLQQILDAKNSCTFTHREFHDLAHVLALLCCLL